ncbi:ABC transporter substrate-binding protein, partial [Piscirickettsia salmonis]|uniref:ABC transporter substrate-binding protein n=1 Tax=Piscirickettsia salmonis TaxID=1238 RepID=UPI001C54F6AF
MPRRFSRAVLAGSIAGALLHAGAARAQISDDVIRIGFITDMSGVYSGPDGPGGAEAIKMAIEEMGGEINGKKIELLTADHQNKADIASAKARERFDQKGVTMLIAGANSAAALAMAKVAEEKKTPFFVVSAGASELTNSQCPPSTVHYVH